MPNLTPERPENEPPASTKRRRRPRRAGQPWEFQKELTEAYLNCYVGDDEFRQALLDLYQTWCAPNGQFRPWSPALPEVTDRVRPERRVHEGGDLPFASPAWVLGYVDAVKMVAKRFGLDRLGRSGSGASSGAFASRGEHLIHTWLQLRAQATEDGEDWPLGRFIDGAQVSGQRPNIGVAVPQGGVLEYQGRFVSWASVPLNLRRIEEGENVRSWVSTPRPIGRRAPPLRLAPADLPLPPPVYRPLVRIALKSQWDPRVEPIASARKRLLEAAEREIDTELDHLAAEAEDRGYVFPARDEAVRDVRWLYWRVRHRLKYDQIVKRWEQEQAGSLDRRLKRPKGSDPQRDRKPALRHNTELAKKAVIRMAKRIGIDRTVR